MTIIQEKYVVMIGDTILTFKGFKKAKSNLLRLSQVRLFNSISEAKILVSTKYSGEFKIKKVLVTIDDI